jgi:hypothetical protein
MTVYLDRKKQDDYYLGRKKQDDYYLVLLLVGRKCKYVHTVALPTFQNETKLNDVLDGFAFHWFAFHSIKGKARRHRSEGRRQQYDQQQQQQHPQRRQPCHLESYAVRPRSIR